jgi:hypothetical protein
MRIMARLDRPIIDDDGIADKWTESPEMRAI